MAATFSMTFLGVGSGLNPALGNNNVLVESGDRREQLLLDCGFLTTPRLKEMGNLPDIRHIVITHVHMDHVGGLELLADFHLFVYHQRPHLYFPLVMYEELWDHCLRGGLEASQDGDGKPLKARLETYFQVHALREHEAIAIAGLPVLTFVPTLHIPGKPAYGYFIGNDIYYSGDTQELPPRTGPTGKPLRAIFQDCQLYDEGVHTPLQQLDELLPSEIKAITWLMHYSEGHERYRPEEMGFAGFVRPMQRFEFPLEPVPVKTGLRTQD